MGKKINVPLQPAALSAAIVWADAQRTAGIAEEARAKFTVTTSVTGNSRVADTDETTTMIVTVVTKFDGVNVDCDTTPSGWTRTATGTYQKTLANASSGTIAAQAFTYTPPASSPYAGIVCTKSSTAQSIAVTWPTYTGWATAKNVANIVWSTGIVRRTAPIGSSTALTDITETNATGFDAYFFILSRSASVRCQQSGNTVIDAALTNVSFTSPSDEEITLTGYRLYFTTADFAAGASPKFGVQIPLT